MPNALPWFLSVFQCRGEINASFKIVWEKKYGVPLVRVRRRWFWRICLLGSSTLSRELVTWSRSFECRVEKGLKNIPLPGTLTRNVWRTRERLKFSTELTKSHLVYSWRSTKVYLRWSTQRTEQRCVVFVLRDKRKIRISQVRYYANAICRFI